MNTEIINRVAKSNLITIDLTDYYPKGKRAVIDIKNWLKEGLVLIEKDFRQSLNNYNWNQFKGHHIAIFCSTDAIIPIWAYMLVQKNLNGIAKSITYGSTETMESVLIIPIIESLDLEYCKDKPVVIKGCSDKNIPRNAYIKLIEKLQPIAKSIMFGEACSSVPLFKKK
ncbi:MAG: DUF2480 family protein [Flavobacteriaceae bacterium]|jgi:hypothetical protein|tara:strand:- start:757 stop:1263 length:507 start_codon:yes stop_codon:yes gene_type:complete